jgi:hypothetical protein
MQVFKLPLLFLSCLIVLASCERVVERDVIVDNIIYGIDTVPVYTSSADKDKVKTSTQFISTMYSNLYFQPIGANTLSNLSLLQLANGDKGLANDLILGSFIIDPAVQATIPSMDDMRLDPEAFVDQTYLRFFLRLPTAYERFGLVQMIEDDTELSPEDIYRAFCLSNEYLFY